MSDQFAVLQEKTKIYQLGKTFGLSARSLRGPRKQCDPHRQGGGPYWIIAGVGTEREQVDCLSQVMAYNELLSKQER